MVKDSDVKALRKEISELREEIEELSDKIDSLEDKIDDLKDILQSEKMDKQLKEWKKLSEQVETELAKRKKNEVS